MCAATALSSKLVASQKDFFSRLVVDAVKSLDSQLSLKMIGIKKVSLLLPNSFMCRLLVVPWKILYWLMVLLSRKLLAMLGLECSQNLTTSLSLLF